MRNKSKKAAKATKTGTRKAAKAASKAKTKTSKQVKSKTKASAGKKPKAGASTRTKSKTSKTKATAKTVKGKSGGPQKKGTNFTSKKRAVQKQEETPVIAHGANQHFIPSHETGGQMPLMNTRLDEKILENRERAIMNQENQKAKAALNTRVSRKRGFRMGM